LLASWALNRTYEASDPVTRALASLRIAGLQEHQLTLVKGMVDQLQGFNQALAKKPEEPAAVPTPAQPPAPKRAAPATFDPAKKDEQRILIKLRTLPPDLRARLEGMLDGFLGGLEALDEGPSSKTG